jgi:hypothetical protein
MDANQLQELAINARLDHWPPHLGVRTEGEKVEYLAERLREASREVINADALADENTALQEEVAEWQRKAEQAEDKLNKVRDLVHV